MSYVLGEHTSSSAKARIFLELLETVKVALNPLSMHVERSILQRFFDRGYTVDDMHNVVLGLRSISDDEHLSLRMVYATTTSSTPDRVARADGLFGVAHRAGLEVRSRPIDNPRKRAILASL